MVLKYSKAMAMLTTLIRHQQGTNFNFVTCDLRLIYLTCTSMIFGHWISPMIVHEHSTSTGLIPGCIFLNPDFLRNLLFYKLFCVSVHTSL